MVVVLYVRNFSLHRIPTEIAYLNSLMYIDLSDNSLITLTPEVFQFLSTIITLHLNLNNISQIPGQSFLGLRRLTSVIIAEQNLQKLEDSSFDDLHSVKILNLSHNSLT